MIGGHNRAIGHFGSEPFRLYMHTETLQIFYTHNLKLSGLGASTKLRYDYCHRIKSLSPVLVGSGGVEPPYVGTKARCLTTWLRTKNWWKWVRFELPNRNSGTGLQPACFGHLHTLPNFVRVSPRLSRTRFDRTSSHSVTRTSRASRLTALV